MHGGGDDTPLPHDRWRDSADPRASRAIQRPEHTSPAGWSPYGTDEHTERFTSARQSSPIGGWAEAGDLPTARLPAPPTVPVQSPGQRDLPAFLRPPAVWFTGMAAGGIIMIVAIILLTLPPPAPRTTIVHRVPTAIPTDTPTATATPIPVPVFALPAFTDWRAAYIASDGKVHVTSLDGNSDITGPALPLNTANTTNSTLSIGNAGAMQTYTSLSVSPNGMYLAYIDELPQPSGAGVAPPTGNLMLLNLAAQPTSPAWTSVTIPLQVTHIAGWAPDSSRVVVKSVNPTTGATKIYLVYPANQQVAPVPDGSVAGVQVLGWLDVSHVLVMSAGDEIIPPPVSTAALSAVIPLPESHAPVRVPGNAAAGLIASPLSGIHRPSTLSALSPGGYGLLMTMDVQTGTQLAIAQIPTDSRVALSPDGTQIVVANSCVDACASPALTTEIVDPRDGSVHPLPHSDSAIAPVGGFIWQPTVHALAATSLSSVHPPVQFNVSLVDTQQDSARQLQTNAFALGWSPDGSMLVIGDASGLGVATGTTLRLVAPGTGSSVALPVPAVAFIGFVRTAPVPNGALTRHP